MDSLTIAIRASLSSPEVASALTQQPGTFLESLAKSLEQNIRRTIGGGNVYVAKRATRAQLQQRNSDMQREFTGRNLDELADRYGVHPRQARRILTRPKK